MGLGKLPPFACALGQTNPTSDDCAARLGPIVGCLVQASAVGRFKVCKLLSSGWLVYMTPVWLADWEAMAEVQKCSDTGSAR